MIPDPAAPRFELSGGTLRVSGDLVTSDEVDFKEAVFDLLKVEEDPLVIDLSGIRKLTSSYLRHVAWGLMEAKNDGRELKVRASARAARILAMGGLDQLGTIEITDED